MEFPVASAAVKGALLELDDELAAPHVIDLEIAQVLRRLVRQEVLSTHAGAEALNDLALLRLERYPHDGLLQLIWGWRDNLTAYDAAYLALAESLSATLVTRDRAFLGLPNPRVEIQVVA
ncbi:MAG: PIN domain-containing protein [Actinomycetota bacterium]|nr:PIN domain-containing protein [Actinomycetota bacterium]